MTLAVGIIFGLWLLLVASINAGQIAKAVALSSSSKKLRWLRKLYWLAAKSKLLEKTWSSYDHKVYSYLTRYVHKSVALKEYYLKHGYPETQQTLVGKVEELERFVKQWKHNTFDNLDYDELDFIEKWEKENK